MMFRTCVRAAAAVLCSVVYAYAAEVTAIDVSGNRAVAADDLRELLGSAPGDEYRADGVADGVGTVLAYYQGRGFYDARAECVPAFTPDSTGVTLVLTVDEGVRYRLGDVVVNGNRRFPDDDIRAELELEPGRVPDPERFDDGIDRMLERYGDAGYPYAAVEIAEYGLRDSSLWVVLEVREGRQATVRDIRVTGNDATRTRVILREMGIRTGDRFDRSAVERAETRLGRLRFFKKVDPISMEPDATGGNVTLLVHVYEAPMNDFNGVVGYVPPEEDEEDGYVTGRIDVMLKNVSGTGRLLHAEWEKLERKSSDLSFRYEEPWVLGVPVTAGGEFEQQNRELEEVYRYTSIQAGAYVRTPVSDNLEAELGASRDEIIPVSDTTLTGNPDRLLSYCTDVTLVYDTRNDPVNAAAGAYYEMEAGYAFRQGKEDNQTYRLVLQHHIPVFKRQTVSAVFNGSYLQTSDAVPGYGELFELGGANSLRGYRQAQFYGTRIGVISLEYKYFLDRRAAVYLFGDIGYYYRPLEDDVAEDVKAGYGFGGVFSTRMGALKLEYGLGQGDGPAEGKIHVQWQQSF